MAARKALDAERLAAALDGPQIARLLQPGSPSTIIAGSSSSRPKSLSPCSANSDRHG